MKKPDQYIPVSCDLVDQIEIKATKKSCVAIRYLNEGNEVATEGVIETWITRKHVEYLIMSDGTEIRLDRISLLDNQKFSATCTK